MQKQTETSELVVLIKAPQVVDASDPEQATFEPAKLAFQNGLRLYHTEVLQKHFPVDPVKLNMHLRILGDSLRDAHVIIVRSEVGDHCTCAHGRKADTDFLYSCLDGFDGMALSAHALQAPFILAPAEAGIAGVGKMSCELSSW